LILLTLTIPFLSLERANPSAGLPFAVVLARAAGLLLLVLYVLGLLLLVLFVLGLLLLVLYVLGLLLLVLYVLGLLLLVLYVLGLLLLVLCVLGLLLMSLHGLILHLVTLCRLFYLYFPRASNLRANPPQAVPFIYDDAVPLPEANLFLPVVCLVALCVSPVCLTTVHCLQMRKKRD
jgi:hypothetical protein